jgi:two-component system sensor histidine kinase PilS (NtrC family)
MITCLVWLTGDLSSPYITLYIVLISVSSIFLKPMMTLLMALICFGFFIGLILLATFSVIESSGSPQTPARVLQLASFHVVAFMVVGLLAARLADRRDSGEELAQATKNLASLRALHERIIESIRSGLITTDLEGNIYTFNAAASEITGFTADEMAGKSVFALFGDIREPISLSLAESVEGEQPPRFETDLRTPDGFAVRIGYSISRLYSERNESTGLIITFQDLTEIRSMEENVRRKDRLAAVGRVGAGLAHEIRNPLGAMRGAIQVLQSNTPPESIHADLMDIILRESDRLNAIITNFLSYARPKAGNYSDIDVCEAIRETMKLLKHSPDIKDGHEFKQLLPADSIMVSADSTQLKQIFWNLSRNSIHAMPEGGQLTVKVEQIPNNRVRICFEDTGAGMSPDQVEQLFEPFSNSTSGGTGLGLSIVYQIVRDHSGSINVRSSEGEGTVITVELPREGKLAEMATDDEDIHSSAEPTRLEEYLNVKSIEPQFKS